ncbi:catechol-2,3-dioxygenase [Lactobacillus colini]|uniref:Catechol-2,3-dioxygenase n=1 Tax=Lactobacillus colini TaxID=1819254 RepID=A0ABS4MBY4_9LACO|nr:VOC family protein [Lactobacillus colini]MBP2057161.1 catechol-2,3-dioxygenase [Lactobacillus colini]
MEIINLDHMVLTVKNLSVSKKFYHEVIGLPIVDEQKNNFVSLRCGNSLIRLRQLSNAVGAIVADKLQIGVFDFCLETSASVNEILDNFKRFNISIAQGPVTKNGAKGSMTSIYVRDPDGNLVEISTY